MPSADLVVGFEGMERRQRRRARTSGRRGGVTLLKALSSQDACTTVEQLQRHTAFERQFARDSWERRARSAEPASHPAGAVYEGRRVKGLVLEPNEKLKAQVEALTAQLEKADARVAQSSVRSQNLERDLGAVRQTVRSAKLARIEMVRQRDSARVAEGIAKRSLERANDENVKLQGMLNLGDPVSTIEQHLDMRHAKEKVEWDRKLRACQEEGAALSKSLADAQRQIEILTKQVAKASRLGPTKQESADPTKCVTFAGLTGTSAAKSSAGTAGAATPQRQNQQISGRRRKAHPGHDVGTQTSQQPKSMLLQLSKAVERTNIATSIINDVLTMAMICAECNEHAALSRQASRPRRTFMLHLTKTSATTSASPLTSNYSYRADSPLSSTEATLRVNEASQTTLPLSLLAKTPSVRVAATALPSSTRVVSRYQSENTCTRMVSEARYEEEQAAVKIQARIRGCQSRSKGKKARRKKKRSKLCISVAPTNSKAKTAKTKRTAATLAHGQATADLYLDEADAADATVENELLLEHQAAKIKRLEAEALVYKQRLAEEAEAEALNPSPVLMSPQDLKAGKSPHEAVKRIPNGKVLSKLRFMQSRFYNNYDDFITMAKGVAERAAAADGPSQSGGRWVEAEDGGPAVVSEEEVQQRLLHAREDLTAVRQQTGSLGVAVADAEEHAAGVSRRRRAET